MIQRRIICSLFHFCLKYRVRRQRSATTGANPLSGVPLRDTRGQQPNPAKHQENPSGLAGIGTQARRPAGPPLTARPTPERPFPPLQLRNPKPDIFCHQSNITCHLNFSDPPSPTPPAFTSPIARARSPHARPKLTTHPLITPRIAPIRTRSRSLATVTQLLSDPLGELHLGGSRWPEGSYPVPSRLASYHPIPLSRPIYHQSTRDLNLSRSIVDQGGATGRGTGQEPSTLPIEVNLYDEKRTKAKFEVAARSWDNLLSAIVS